ncbi:Ig-like domain-containing protein [Tahibacter aquaticus]|uniref:Ig-like domain-containing protein n=1 Tax=Tahibacter aquaticus TaxID=520092 RepID=UPI0014150B8F|nr:Ig-like domain-containing protein [Tahibacter aquaticus]
MAFATIALAAVGGLAQAAFDPNANWGIESVAVQPDGRVLVGGPFWGVGGVARAGFARLAADGTVEADYPNVTGGPTYAVAVQADGKALIGGKGLSGSGGLLRINVDGSIDPTFTDAMTGSETAIRVIVPQADGSILIGGSFWSAGGETRNNIARLNADGTLDASFDAGTVVNRTVQDIQVQPDGRIVVAGDYMQLVRLLGNGQRDTAQPLAAITSSETYFSLFRVHVQVDGKILVGGYGPLKFSDGIARGQLVRLNADGSPDTGYASQVTGPGGGVRAPIVRQPDGKILIGGGFTSVGGQPRNYIARLNADGSVDSSLIDPEINQPIAALALQTGGKILIAGDNAFTMVSGLTRNRIARLHPDGRLDNGATAPLVVTPYASAHGAITPASPQSVAEGSKVSFGITPESGYAVAAVTGCGGMRLGNTYVTGWIWNDCTVVASFVAAGDVSFDPDANGYVERIATQPDGKIVVAGWYTRIGNQPKIKIARLDPADGSADPAFMDGSGIYQANTGGDVGYTTVVQPDGKVLFGGDRGLLRINADGTRDIAFVAGLGSGATVKTIVLQPDAKILVAGYGFSTARSGIARLNADGSVDTSFNPEFDRVSGIALEPNGKILLSGVFEGVEQLARVNANGSPDTSFPTIPNGTVDVMVRLANGSYLLGGSTFINLNDGVQPTSHLVRIFANGARDLSFDTVVAGGYGGVETIALQPDGGIVIGGGFGTVNGTTRNNVARLDANGGLDTAFNVPVNGRVTTIAFQADGKILIGGKFTRVEGYVRNNIARLKATGRIDVNAFTVTPLAGANGTITPNGTQTVDPGQTVQLTIVPDAGYVIGHVAGCGGTLSGLVYTTAPVVGHCNVTADFVFETVTYHVTPAAGANGKLLPDTRQAVLFAQTTPFTVVPDAGYYLAAIEGCGGSLAGTVYTTGHVVADCNVIARFHRPAALAAMRGTPQASAVNTAFAVPLTVRVTDASGAPVAGVAVDFAAPASGASATLSAASATTDANGEARVTARANASGGNYVVTAAAQGLQAAFALRNEVVEHGGLELKVTVSTEPPPACGTASEIDAVPGEQINYCFTVTNHSDITLNYHTLTMVTFGFPSQYQYQYWGQDRFFSQREQALPPGGSYRYNRLITAGTQDQAPLFTWSATASLPDYEKDAGAAVPFTDISGTGTAVPALEVYGRYPLRSLPFPITFYGQVFREGALGMLCINNSGSVYLRRGGGDEECPTADVSIPPLLSDNSTMPAVSYPGPYPNGLAVYWDLLGTRGKIYYATLGTAPNRRLIVQWNGKDHALYPNPARGITFQVVFEEGTGKIHYVYDHLTFDVLAEPNPDMGGSATVGLFGYTIGVDLSSPGAPQPFRQHSYSSPVLTDGQAITWTPTDVPRYASSEVLVSVGMPRLAVLPGAIETSAAAAAQVHQALTIGNDGDMDLAWSLAEAAAQAHFPPAARRYVPPAGSRDANGAGFDDAPGLAGGNPQNDPAPRSVFAVPAYAWGGWLSFDAANPTQLVHGAGIARLPDGMAAIDFAGNDFSRQYALGNDGSFAQIEAASGATSVIGMANPVGLTQVWSGLAWDASTDTMFAATTNGQGCAVANASELYTINLATAAATRIGAINTGAAACITSIAVSPEGALYGIDNFNNTLVAIDKTSGQAATIGWLGFNLADGANPNSADFDAASGTLYLLSNNGAVYTVDLVTGLASRVGVLPAIEPEGTPVRGGIDGLSIAVAGGRCAHPAQLPWLTVNQTAGVTPPGARAAIDVTLNAAGLAPGRYEANLCVFSNDRSRSLVRVPVGFTVTVTGDRVFANGFDAATP